MFLGDLRRRLALGGHEGDAELTADRLLSSERMSESWEILRHLHRGSSEVDWCESNYRVSASIAEFVNTFSNILFLVIPPLLIVLFQQYSKNAQTRAIYVVWLLLIVIGLSSAYFHATLSFAGQMLDELAILWMICACLSLWTPVRFLPAHVSRYGFKWVMLAVTVIFTVAACVRPVVNAFVLLVSSFPIAVMLYVEVKRCQDDKIRRLGFRNCVVFGIAIFCWLNDRILCDVWAKWSFPYLHGVFHILIFLSSYTCCVLFAFFDAPDLAPKFTPRLRYWPVDTFEFGIPYVTLTSRGHIDKPHDL